MEEPQRETRRRMLKSVLAVAGQGLLHVRPRGDAAVLPPPPPTPEAPTPSFTLLLFHFQTEQRRWETNYMVSINHTFSNAIWKVTSRANNQVHTLEVGVLLMNYFCTKSWD